MRIEKFCPASLEDWLLLCAEAGVSYVPAYKVGTILQEDFMNFDLAGEHLIRLRDEMQSIRTQIKPHHMLRWDFCSSTEVKSRMGMGLHEWDSSLTMLPFDDPRAFDIMMQYPREEIPVWQRPWIQAEIYHSYPVEYRVFVLDGKIQGVSNYYPQRPLEWHTRTLVHVSMYTQLLIDVLQKDETKFEWHKHFDLDRFKKNHSLDDIHFTADFMVTNEMGVLFIEGGPPHELGAHPCCFPPGRIDGVALARPPDPRQIIEV